MEKTNNKLHQHDFLSKRHYIFFLFEKQTHILLREREIGSKIKIHHKLQ